MGTPRLRSCTFCLELYPDNESHNYTMDLLSHNGYQYSAILHDCDYQKDDPTIPVKPHFNIVLCFPRQRDLHVVADELEIEPRWLEPARNRAAVERYHCHLDHPDKFQYDPGLIFGPLADSVRAMYEGGKTEDDKVKSLIWLLDTMPKPCSYRTFIMAAAARGLYSSLRRMGSLFKPLLDEHNGYTDGT